MAFYFLGDGTVDVPVWFDDEADYFAALKAAFSTLLYQDITTPNRVGTVLGTEQIQPSFEEAHPQPVWLASYTIASGVDAWGLLEDAAAPSNNISGNIDTGFANSGTLSGIGAVSGDASLTFTNAATITGVGSLSGDATFAFANSGTLTGLGAISGSTGLNFASGGDVFGFGAIVGNTTLDFAPSATVDVAGQSGNTTLDFALAGTLGGFGALAGDISTSFSLSGTLVGLGSVSGSTTLDFASSGTATIASSNDVSGNTGLDFGLSGTLDPIAGSIQIDGDIGSRLSRKKPLVFIRPKAERELDDILEIIDSVSESDRVSENKRKLKQAKALIQKVDVLEQYQDPVAIVKRAIFSLAREAAVHEGLKTKLMTASLQIEAIVAAMQQQRKRRQRDEEALLYLL